jgi:hypothetical protein
MYPGGPIPRPMSDVSPSPPPVVATCPASNAAPDNMSTGDLKVDVKVCLRSLNISECSLNIFDVP